MRCSAMLGSADDIMPDFDGGLWPFEDQNLPFRTRQHCSHSVNVDNSHMLWQKTSPSRASALIAMCLLLEGCSHSSPTVSLARGKLSFTLAGKGDCIRGGAIIDQQDVTIISFEQKDRRECFHNLTITSHSAEIFTIIGELSEIVAGRTYMVVVDHDAQWELRRRVIAD